ncbi:hypothetical protein BU25DRAFT_35375 [Macroventuria anomochaeta]|uniref:Uncharacterized protein n=1 Tax=Macroventuria anomochaeta TaxID=301207 RepID=A0ACB6S440_9PLEO|nr:uncharacterized protein BU25DRAFT_35375 [Macroventuria anomochaeta]KAF2628420.1 hypothetical protein BU25DRAFT_35375 [Macroventuria anomochaeta]
MSFVPQPQTSCSQRGFSKSWPKAQTTPRSKFTQCHAASIAANDRPKKASRSPSVASEDLVLLPPPSPLFPDDGPADNPFETWKDLKNFTRASDFPEEDMGEAFSWNERQYCDICKGFCPFGLAGRRYGDGMSSVPKAALQPDPWTEDDFRVYNSPFAFSPGQLNKLLNPKSLAAFYVLGGLQGIERGLRSGRYAGLGMYERSLSYMRRFEQGAFARKKVEGPHTDEQPSFRNPEDHRRQQALMRKSRTYREVHNRCKLQREPSRLPRDPPVGGMILDAANKIDDNDFYPLRTEIEVKCDKILGQISLKIWRRAAGKNKSWKRCPKTTVPRQTHHKWVRLSPSGFEHQFAKSPLWLPAAFLRSQARKKSSRLSCVVRRQVSDQVPERARRYDPHIHNNEDCSVALHRRYRATTIAHDNKVRKFGPVVIEDIREPAGAFIRFTWKDNILTNGVGQLDRFLPTGLVFRTGWCIVGFLRNESHTDVYSLSNASFGHSSARTEVSREAHVFLDEYHGNCKNYARRLKSRMRESVDCLETFWYGDRHVFVMEIQRKPVLFRLRNNEEEFPILVDQNKCNEQVALQRRRFRGKPSFAAVVGGRRPNIEFDHRPTPMPKDKSALEKELEQIEKARLKKAERQRVKRQLQRDKRLEEKLQSMEGPVEEKSAYQVRSHFLKIQSCRL